MLFAVTADPVKRNASRNDRIFSFDYDKRNALTRLVYQLLPTQLDHSYEKVLRLLAENR